MKTENTRPTRKCRLNCKITSPYFERSDNSDSDICDENTNLQSRRINSLQLPASFENSSDEFTTPLTTPRCRTSKSIRRKPHHVKHKAAPHRTKLVESEAQQTCTGCNIQKIKPDKHSKARAKVKKDIRRINSYPNSTTLDNNDDNGCVGSSENNTTDEESDSNNDWEEVENAQISAPKGEVDFMSQLLNNQVEEEDEVEDEEDLSRKNIVISVSADCTGKNKTQRDPKVLEALLLNKQMKERQYTAHTMHTIGMLTYARFANRTCDDDFIRCLGFSLLGDVNEVWNGSGSFLSVEKWKLEHLRFTIFSFITRVSSKTKNQLLRSLSARLEQEKANQDDVTILMVAALRSIGFDTRLVVAFNPMSLKPGKPVPQYKRKSKTLKPLKNQAHNEKILSSSESDIETTDSVFYSMFMEVYLPSSKSWISVDLKPPVGRVESDAFQMPCLYAVGFSSAMKCASIEPYLGRSPVDLAARYDPTWMTLASRTARVLDALWSSLMSKMKYFCDADASRCDLREQDSSRQPELRDAADFEVILNKLRLSPLPTRVQEFKNHPLYALKRHLLKFEVIYPEDSTTVGFLKVSKSESDTEAIYPRECVYLCHTRESWLKEAKSIRIGEKPAKVVKARLSMKRKLLQDENGPPPTVDVYGPWQVEDYVPAVAVDGKVPRNEHGNVELFKACMLPIGCVHIRLPGIQHIAKQLSIDIAQAMVGWTFHGAGWAHPDFDGYVVCKEQVPALVDAWRAQRMNSVKAAAVDRAERALTNWRRLTRHLLLWQRVEAQFRLIKSTTSGGAHSKLVSSPMAKHAKAKPVGDCIRSQRFAVDHHANHPTVVNLTNGWKRLNMGANDLPAFPCLLEVETNKKKQRVSKCPPVAKRRQTFSRRKKGKKQRKKSPSRLDTPESTEEEEQ